MKTLRAGVKERVQVQEEVWEGVSASDMGERFRGTYSQVVSKHSGVKISIQSPNLSRAPGGRGGEQWV